RGKVRGELPKERLSGVPGSFVELLRGALLFFDGSLARRHLRFVPLCVRLVANAARFLELEPVELILSQRNFVDLSLEQGADPFDGSRAHLQVTVFDFG